MKRFLLLLALIPSLVFSQTKDISALDIDTATYGHAKLSTIKLAGSKGSVGSNYIASDITKTLRDSLSAAKISKSDSTLYSTKANATKVRDSIVGITLKITDSTLYSTKANVAKSRDSVVAITLKKTDSTLYSTKANVTKVRDSIAGIALKITDSTLYSTKANVTKVRDSLQANINLKAPSASPTFTGTVTVPTVSSSDNSTKAASTAYVQSAISGLGGGGGGLTTNQVKSLISSTVGFVDPKDFGAVTGLNPNDHSSSNIAAITANTIAIQQAIDWAVYGDTVAGLAFTQTPPPSKIINFGYEGVYVTNNTLKACRGDGRGVASVILMGGWGFPSYDINLSTSTTKGVCIYSINSSAPCINFQGAVKSAIVGINVIGCNALNTSRGNYGNWSVTRSNYISPFLSATATNTNAPYVGISIDAYCGSKPTGGYDNDTYGKLVSSDVVVENCIISNFIVGWAVHPSGQGGQGEFTPVRNTSIRWCLTGATISNSQNRLPDFYRVHIDIVNTCISTDEWGVEKNGGFGTFTSCTFSGNRLANIPYCFTPPSFIGCYIESIVEFGRMGSLNTNSKLPMFVNCDLNTGQHEMGRVPRSLFTGDRVKFSGGHISGTNMDFDVTDHVTLDGVSLDNKTDYFYDVVLNWGSVEGTPLADPYRWMLYNHPISSGDGRIYSLNGTTITASGHYGGTLKFPYTEESYGSNVAKHFPFLSNSGFSGVAGDYFYKAQMAASNFWSADTSATFSGLKLTTDISNFTPNSIATKLIQRGDIFRYKTGAMKGMKFLVTKRGTINAGVVTSGVGNKVELVLLNGFDWYENSNDFYEDASTDSVTVNASNSTITFQNPHTIKAGVIVRLSNGFRTTIDVDVTNSTTAHINFNSSENYVGKYVLEHQAYFTNGSATVTFSTPMTLRAGETIYISGSSQTGIVASNTTNSTTATITVPASVTTWGNLNIRHIDFTVKDYLLPDSLVLAQNFNNTWLGQGEIEWFQNTSYPTLPTKATATSGSSTLTGLGYIDTYTGAPTVSNQFVKGSLVYIYTYGVVPTIQTNKTEAYVIQDITSSTMVLDRNVTFSGDVIVSNIWPYTK
jgi:hypothetical protein